MNRKLKLLIISGLYWPSVVGGGPVQSSLNLTAALRDIFDVRVISDDRDYDGGEPYTEVIAGEWNDIRGVPVYYMPRSKQNFRGFLELLSGIDYDVIYLNGYFSPRFTLIPVMLAWLGKIRRDNMIVAPRGDLTAGMEWGRAKKKLFNFAVRLLGVYDRVYWHASSDIEQQGIRRVFPRAEIYTICDLAERRGYAAKPGREKKPGELRLAFVSRIHYVKGLDISLRALSKLRTQGSVVYDIYGPIEEPDYWEQCRAIIDDMPENITVRYMGVIDHDAVYDTLSEYQAFYFTTRGENYGHVVVEAAASGCCLLMSDTTPWRDLEEYGVGWDFPLDSEQGYIDALEYLVKMDQDEYNGVQHCLELYVNDVMFGEDSVGKYTDMFYEIGGKEGAQ